MKYLAWDAQKNEELKAKADRPSFDQVVDAVVNGGLVRIMVNRSVNHPEQMVMVIKIPGFVHLVAVPYRDRGWYYQLITAMPDRRLTKKSGG